MKRDRKYWDKKFPGRYELDGKLVFFWQSACIDAIDSPCILPGNVWELLCQYDKLYGEILNKEYSSADRAISDLLKAIARSEQGESK